MDQYARQTILKIAARAVKLARDHGNSRVRELDVIMAVHLTHEARPLRLVELLEADDGNFAHDVFGILRHIDPGTGEMGDCFLPRFTAHTEAANG